MEGIFKGRLLGESFGFVVPDDQSKDIFVRKSSTPESLAAEFRILIRDE